MHVTLIAAQSLDGFITRHDDTTPAFTSAADRAYFPRALQAFDCSIMGATTYRAQREYFRHHRAQDRRRMVLTRAPSRHQADAQPGALEFTDEAPATLVARLADNGHRRCALLGGAQIHSLFLAAGLVQEIWLTMEPRLFGGGTPFLAERTDLTVRLLDFERLPESDSLVVKYRVLP